MTTTPDTLRTHLDYTSWASKKLVEAAAQLSPEELERDFNTADRSVLGTLVHVYAGDRVWLRRIHGEPQTPFIDPGADMRLSVLQNDWPPLLERWRNWAAGLDDEAIHKKINYKDLAGNDYETPLWQIVYHAVNHGTHHRGQVAGFLRAMGHRPPKLDLLAYYRELGG